MTASNVRSRKRIGGENRLVRLLIRVGLLLLAVFLIYQTGRTIYHTKTKLDIIANAKSEVDSLRLKNLEVYIRNSEVTSDDHVETESRDRLNYTRDGEVVFVIEEGLVESAELEIYLDAVKSNGDDVSSKEVYQEWVDFFKGYSGV